MSARWFIGLALAPSGGSIAAVERVSVETGEHQEIVIKGEVCHLAEFIDHLHVRHIERIAHGAPLAVVVGRIRSLLASKGLASAEVSLMVDSTSLGAATVDVIRRAELRCAVTPLVLSDGDREGARVPRRDLAALLATLLESHQLHIASAMPHAAELRGELRTLETRVSEPGSIAVAVALPVYRCGRHLGPHLDRPVALGINDDPFRQMIALEAAEEAEWTL